MKLSYDYSKSFFLIDRRLNKEIWIEKSGVKKGYAMDMFTRMFDAIFSELIDVKREYEKYYAFEYQSMEMFLYKKYNLSEDSVAEIMTLQKANSECVLYRKDDYSYGDYGIMQFAFSDSMFDRVTNMLTLKK